MAVLVETSVGDLVIDLHTDKCENACINFLKLCKVKYYNNCLFYCVEKDFIAKSGDPTNTGKGGNSVHGLIAQSSSGENVADPYFKDEFHHDLKHNAIGVVGVANDKPNMNSSQFYITLRKEIDYLDGKHTIFGKVTEGLDVLTDKINPAFVDDEKRPLQNIRVYRTIIIEDPFDDPVGLAKLIPDSSPEPIVDEGIGAVTNINDEIEVLEKIAANEAKSRTVTLEILGDLPSADLKPPENVLFICKLNPYTEAADLELIFSRFGTILTCEIIRDWKTGDSLQYGFIEFEDIKACETAYFKMQNCLIDDRRIHVDFCQSVSKQWMAWRRKSNKGTQEDKREVMEIAAGRGRQSNERKQMPLTAPQRGGRDAAAYEFMVDESASTKAVPTSDAKIDRKRHRDRDRDRVHEKSPRERKTRTHEDGGSSHHQRQQYNGRDKGHKGHSSRYPGERRNE